MGNGVTGCAPATPCDQLLLAFIEEYVLVSWLHGLEVGRDRKQRSVGFRAADIRELESLLAKARIRTLAHHDGL